MSTEHEVLEHGPLAAAIRESVAEAGGVEEDNIPIIEEAYITQENELLTADDLAKLVIRKSMRCFDTDRIHNELQNSSLVDIAKSIEGSTQSIEEIGRADSLAFNKIVEPPYPPELLAAFLEVDETHFRCVKAKVTDAVGRDFEFEARVKVIPNYEEADEDDEEFDSEPTSPVDKLRQKLGDKGGNGKPTPSGDVMKPSPIDKLREQQQQQRQQQLQEQEDTHTQDEIDAEIEIVRKFLVGCNELIGFEGVLERSGMDYEGIGWAGIEVIRGKDMKIKKLAHIPASRLRVLRGWKGFVEIRSGTASTQPGAYIYYQNFGDKVVSTKNLSPLTNKPLPYNPEDDGELAASSATFNLIDKVTGEPTSDFNTSANEILWIPKHHSNTVYYGFSDVVPALGAVLGNVHIRDFMLQFFEHNTVPRYAIIVTGAKLGDKVIKAITEYFGEHVKGKAHKTLIIPIPAVRGEVTIKFEKLGADSQEGSFQETRKNNSQIIMTAHGVSPAIIGINEAASLGSGKGLSQAEIYKDRIVTPTQKSWARPINRLFYYGLGVQLIALRFNPLDIRDLADECSVLTKYQDKGCVTINQVRKKARLGEPLEGGDRAFVIVQGGIQFVDELSGIASAAVEEAATQVDQMQQELNSRDQQAAHQAEVDQAHAQGQQVGVQNAVAAARTAPPAKPPKPAAAK